MKNFALDEWKRAWCTIKSAEQLVETDPDSAASRAYYAAFHAVTAVFALRGQEFSKHAAIRTALHKDLIKTNVWASDLGSDYDYLMDLRETGDYGGLMHVSPENAQAALECAKRIFEAAVSTHPELESDI